MNSEQRKFLANLSFEQLTNLMLAFYYALAGWYVEDARELGITLEIVTLAINDRVYNSEVH
jgi:hypothetical protein